MKLTEFIPLTDSVLENLRDGCLFYPCAGDDVLLPVELFAPFITDFVFVDKAYFDPSDQDGRYMTFGRPVKSAVPALERHPAYALVEVKIWRSRPDEPQYRYWLGPCQRTEIYTHLPTGRIIRLHRIRDAGFRAFTRMPIKFQVFFYRGDSEGEGGSGNHWLSERWVEAVLSRMTDQGLVVTDGYNTGFEENPYAALWSSRGHDYCRSMNSRTGHRLDWIQAVNRTTHAWEVRDLFGNAMDPIRSRILSAAHDHARDSMTARNLHLPREDYTVPIRLQQIVELKPSVIEASEQGNPIAQAKRAAYLLSGSDHDIIRMDEAVVWLEKSAAQGCKRALRNLTFILEKGLANQVADPVRALPYWAALADTGDVWAGYHCAQLLERGHIPKTGDLSIPSLFQERILGWTRQAAEQKYAPAILDMARYCKDGFASQPIDLRQALHWYSHFRLWSSSAGQRGYFQVLKSIAVEGDWENLVELGDCYRDGTGCARDIQAARSCYQKAADNGIRKGLMSLGKLLASHGNAEDDNDRMWLEAAARTGCDSARLALVAWYGTWINDAPRDEMAVQHWLQGHNDCASRIYSTEFLVRKTTAVALDENQFMRAWQACDRLKQWSPKSARRCRRPLIDFLVHTPSTDVPAGLMPLFLHLARSGPFRKEANIAYSLARLWDGGSLPADAKQAAYWYRRAANRGHVEAQLAMARLCATGTGVTADPDAARGWENLARKNQ